MIFLYFFFPSRLNIITMTKIYIFLMTIIILVVSRRVNKPPSSKHKDNATAFQQSHPIQFEELQPRLIIFVASESDLPKISEYSQVETIYPHAKAHLEEGKIAQKQANSSVPPKKVIEKKSVKQQSQNRNVKKKIKQKDAKPIEKNETVLAQKTKRPKQLKQAQQVFSSGPSSLSLRKEISVKTKGEPNLYLTNFTQVLPSQNLLIILLAVCLFGIFLLSKCFKDNNDYHGLNPNDQQQSFTN